MTEAGRCPVCQARFRGTVHCSRCGADLTPLMTLAARAWRLRAAARKAIIGGDFKVAAELAAAAQQTQRTEVGNRIHQVASALSSKTAC